MEIPNMAYSHALSQVPRVFRAVPFVELRQSLPSHVAVISLLVDQLMRFIAKFRAVDGSEFDIDMALREALLNAVIHGNQEDARKRVTVACRCTTDGEVSVTVQDEGQGFDSGIVPDPTVSENRLHTYGRGIYLMKTLMDEVSFDQGGAVVYMRKRPNGDPEAGRKSQ
jgi:serine/threonine-protein kinase RsbW